MIKDSKPKKKSCGEKPGSAKTIGRPNPGSIHDRRSYTETGGRRRSGRFVHAQIGTIARCRSHGCLSFTFRIKLLCLMRLVEAVMTEIHLSDDFLSMEPRAAITEAARSYWSALQCPSACCSRSCFASCVECRFSVICGKGSYLFAECRIFRAPGSGYDERDRELYSRMSFDGQFPQSGYRRPSA